MSLLLRSLPSVAAAAAEEEKQNPVAVTDWRRQLRCMRAGRDGGGPSPNRDSSVCGFCQQAGHIVHEGHHYCRLCGTWQQRMIDCTPEWRNFHSTESSSWCPDRSRCGLPISDLLPGVTLSSWMGTCNNMDACMRLARRFHIWGALTHRDRKTCAVFDTLTLKALASGIPTSIVDDAKALYLRVAASVVTRGLQRQAIVASTIYISCKDHDVPRATPEIAEIFDVRRCDMTRACKRVQDLLDLRLNCTGSDDFVSRFCSRLDLTPELTGVCYHIVWRLTNLRLLLRHTPPTITGACICLVLHCTLPPPPPPTQRPPHRLDKHTLLAVAEACRMSASTIHKCFQQVFAARGVLLPRDFLVRHRVK